MKRNLLTGTVLLLGILAGIGLMEVGLRFFMPQLLTFPEAQKGYIPADELVFAPGDKLIVSPAEEAPTREIIFNKYGYRDDKDIANADRGDWVVYGGSIAVGLGAAPDEWFGSHYDYEPEPKVYNAAFVGGSNYFVPMVEHAFANGAKAGRAVFVVDLSLHPDLLLNQKETFDAPQQHPAAAESTILQRLALARALGLAEEPQEQMPEAVTQRQARQIAQAMWPALAPYSTERERNAVLVVPARGYWLEDGFGTVHRQNQERVASALRSRRNVYVVDAAYMMRDSYATPLDLYYNNGRLKPEGQKVLAEGWQRQVRVFNEWKSFDELSPAEQEKVKKQQEESARKRKQKQQMDIFE